ncbi:MAG: hypothetical protein FH756_09510 [Firmicutes bacterium]|nr:hypothetical protein [Bacillota bacterium]
MFVVFITRIRDKVMLFFRVLLFLSILFILVLQIYTAVMNSELPGHWQHDDPSGKPMRVDASLKKDFEPDHKARNLFL